MNYCLITPYKVHPKHNAGWHMITAGIKYLIRKADPEATFENVSMFKKPDNHDFSKYDRLVLCGNPRYDNNQESGQWMYEGLLTKFLSFGIPLIDAWQGAGSQLGLSIEDSVKLLSKTKRNQNTMKLLENSKIITRDLISQKLNEKHNLDSILLPCSSFWAADEYGIGRNENKTEKIVVVYRMDGYAGIQGILKTMLRTHKIIATSSFDSEWCKSFGLKHEMIFDPIELLKLYSISKEVISFRLHAAIPAASLGCSVFACGIDTRVQACELFGMAYGDYRDGVGESKVIPYMEPLDISSTIK